jgi:hypothetical protein
MQTQETLLLQKAEQLLVVELLVEADLSHKNIIKK